LSEADNDIIRLDERTIMDYECFVVADTCPVGYARTVAGKSEEHQQQMTGNYELDVGKLWASRDMASRR